MTYRYVQSATDLGPAKGPRLAFVWHMAEGGGTVGFLAKPNPNGVSVHFVVEYSGNIVQMLPVDHMHSSLRISTIRGTDDSPYQYRGETITYGATAARSIMGKWADTRDSLGPNHASIAAEVEGFAATGPNDAQTSAIAKLGRDLGLPALGHRDFQSYKACPGHQFPWFILGGHANPAAEEAMRNLIVGADRVMGDVALGTPYYDAPNGKQIGTTGGTFEWHGSPTMDDGVTRDPAWILIVGLTPEFMRVPGIARYIKRTALTNIRAFPAADCSAWETWYALAPK